MRSFPCLVFCDSLTTLEWWYNAELLVKYFQYEIISLYIIFLHLSSKMSGKKRLYCVVSCTLSSDHEEQLRGLILSSYSCFSVFYRVFAYECAGHSLKGKVHNTQSTCTYFFFQPGNPASAVSFSQCIRGICSSIAFRVENSLPHPSGSCCKYLLTATLLLQLDVFGNPL